MKTKMLIHFLQNLFPCCKISIWANHTSKKYEHITFLCEIICFRKTTLIKCMHKVQFLEELGKALAFLLFVLFGWCWPLVFPSRWYIISKSLSRTLYFIRFHKLFLYKQLFKFFKRTASYDQSIIKKLFVKELSLQE